MCCVFESGRQCGTGHRACIAVMNKKGMAHWTVGVVSVGATVNVLLCLEMLCWYMTPACESGTVVALSVAVLLHGGGNSGGLHRCNAAAAIVGSACALAKAATITRCV